MSLIKQKSIRTLIGTSSISYDDMGEIVLNSVTPITITVPNATNARGLWYRFINVNNETHIINTSTPTLITNVAPYVSILIMSDGTNWIIAGSSSGCSIVL